MNKESIFIRTMTATISHISIGIIFKNGYTLASISIKILKFYFSFNSFFNAINILNINLRIYDDTYRRRSKRLFKLNIRVNKIMRPLVNTWRACVRGISNKNILKATIAGSTYYIHMEMYDVHATIPRTTVIISNIEV